VDNSGSRRAVGIHPDLVSVPIKTAEMLTGAGWEGGPTLPLPAVYWFSSCVLGKDPVEFR
jgi:hypothetical protein